MAVNQEAETTMRAERPDFSGMHAHSSSPIFREYLQLLAAGGGEALVASNVGKIQPTDALIVVDMQNDFVPRDANNPEGGLLGVAEGGQISHQIVQLMKHFAGAGAAVVATRDYHPVNHCCFLPGGTFARHCVQGTIGSHFYQPVGVCIRELQQHCQTVFKGFHESIDSFGGIRYPDTDAMRARLCHSEAKDFSRRLQGCTLASWTGSYVLSCSNDKDVNAPPDVLAAYDRQSLTDWCVSKGVKRVFACGLALDYCVQDTVINASKAGFEAFMVLDAARALHNPLVGTIGSGFYEDPAEMVDKFTAVSVGLVSSAMVCPTVQFADIPPLVRARELTKEGYAASEHTRVSGKNGMFSSVRKLVLGPCVTRPDVAAPTAVGI